jgi:transposase InsO family protein
MRKQTTPDQRHTFYRLHQEGLSYPDIAERYGVSRECVRYWCRRQRAGGSCQTVYHKNTAGLLSRFDPRVRYHVLRLRHRHPRWGPGRIRYHLGKISSLRGQALPSVAQIGRYLHQWPRFRRKPKKKRPDQRPHPPTRAHQRHQLDFKTNITLSNGGCVDLHTVCDPVGEMCIGAVLHVTEQVHTRTKRVSLEAARLTLRRSWDAFGTLPDEVQTDGEPTLVAQSANDLPTHFTLWLAGLGIRHLVIRVHTPTDNAEVERWHRTINEYAIVGNEQHPVAALQSILDVAVLELALDLPSRAEGCAGRTPVDAHPEMLEPKRPFRAEHELALFDLRRVDAFLSTFTWTRKVNKSGQISLGGQHEYYNVGRIYAKQEVRVRFDPADRHFVFYQSVPKDDDSAEDELQEIRRQPARHLEVEDLTGMVTCPESLLPQQLPLPFCFVEG